tara:strand:- start:342 stop:1133 length:792 start_codon:yes stop_codon:yes gene_type:complete
MKRGYHLATIKPLLGNVTNGATAYANNDVLFNWTAFEIPTGACFVRTINLLCAGTNGVAGNTHDIQLYYARSIDGAAPSNFGVENAVPTNLLASACKNNIIGWSTLDFSSTDDVDKLISYNIIGSRTASGADATQNSGSTHNVVLQGDPKYSGTVGYQTIWLAGIARGGFDFGTAVALNMGSSANVAADMTGTSVALTTSGTDPRKCFQPGDQLIGSTTTVTMEVVSVDSATTMSVKNVSAQIDHGEELILRSPVKLYMGLEY